MYVVREILHLQHTRYANAATRGAIMLGCRLK